MAWLLSFYECDRAYGGPEEGGWWYDTSALVRTFRCFPTKETAIAAAKRGNALLERLQRNKTSVNSVTYQGGQHAILVHQNCAPTYLPTERPQYA